VESARSLQGQVGECKVQSNLQDSIDISKDTGTSEITNKGDYMFDGVHLKEPNESSDSEVDETNSEMDKSSSTEEEEAPILR
jgi:hypothetical protein